MHAKNRLFWDDWTYACSEGSVDLWLIEVFMHPCMTVPVLHALHTGHSAFVFAFRDAFLFAVQGSCAEIIDRSNVNRDSVLVAMNGTVPSPCHRPWLRVTLKPEMTSAGAQMPCQSAAPMNISCDQ
jgi:hypothetical protein